MKYNIISTFVLIFLFLNLIRTKSIDEKDLSTKETVLGYRIVDAKEAATLILSNKDYLENLNQNDLNFRMQKLNAKLDEYEKFAANQALDFTNKEKESIDDAITLIKNKCKERGYTLPPIDNIIFAKTTSDEENGMEAYTHGTQIYLTKKFLDWAINEEEDEIDSDFYSAITHELFHCFTRNNPEFRKDMYKILGFTVVDKDFEFPKEVSDQIISNPDVEHHNSYATFEINGEKKDCVVIYSTVKPFEKAGDSFFDSENQKICLVPIDNLNTIYTAEEATNFQEVFGENTSYNIDPEETLADNFMLTIIDGYNEENYKTPRIIKSIDDYLKSYKPQNNDSNSGAIHGCSISFIAIYLSLFVITYLLHF